MMRILTTTLVFFWLNQTFAVDEQQSELVIAGTVAEDYANVRTGGLYHSKKKKDREIAEHNFRVDKINARLAYYKKRIEVGRASVKKVANEIDILDTKRGELKEARVTILLFIDIVNQSITKEKGLFGGFFESQKEIKKINVETVAILDEFVDKMDTGDFGELDSFWVTAAKILVRGAKSEGVNLEKLLENAFEAYDKTDRSLWVDMFDQEKGSIDKIISNNIGLRRILYKIYMVSDKTSPYKKLDTIS